MNKLYILISLLLCTMIGSISAMEPHNHNNDNQHEITQLRQQAIEKMNAYRWNKGLVEYFHRLYSYAVLCGSYTVDYALSFIHNGSDPANEEARKIKKELYTIQQQLYQKGDRDMANLISYQLSQLPNSDFEDSTSDSDSDLDLDSD